MSCSARLNTEFVVDTQLDYANIIHYSITGVINATLAILVLYLLIAHSPSSMRIYRWFLMQLVVLSALQDFTMHVLQPHLILPVLAAYLLVPWPLDAIHVHFAFMTWMVLTANGFCAILDGFFYRERCLTVNFYPNIVWLKYWKESTAFWHIGACLIILIPWPMLDVSRDKMRAELERTYPNVIQVMEEQRTFLMYTFDKDSAWFSLALLGASGGFVFILIACIFCFSKIFWVLKLHGKNLSEKTRRLHTSLTKQLLIQLLLTKAGKGERENIGTQTEALVPLLLRLIPDISMIVSAFCLRNLNSSIFGRITVSVASVHSIVNSLLVIFLHKPFRDRVLGWLKPVYGCRKKQNIKTIEHCQSSHRQFTSDHGRQPRLHSHYDDLT